MLHVSMHQNTRLHLCVHVHYCIIQELENVTMLQMSLREANKTCLISRRYVFQIWELLIEPSVEVT